MAKKDIQQIKLDNDGKYNTIFEEIYNVLEDILIELKKP